MDHWLIVRIISLLSVSRKVPNVLVVGFAILAAVLSLTGCAQMFSAQPTAGLPADVSVALTVAAYPLPTLIPPTSAPVVEDPTYTPQPTYTPAPTYTFLPTYTPLPTYTSEPTQTPVIIYPTIPIYPTAVNQILQHPYVLRVRNQNTKVTLWIGTSMPYGGNFIKPLHYVEFYPPQPTWMRIWWCRRGSSSLEFKDEWYRDWEKYWDDSDKYFCQFKDYRVDEAFEEFGVK